VCDRSAVRFAIYFVYITRYLVTGIECRAAVERYFGPLSLIFTIPVYSHLYCTTQLSFTTALSQHSATDCSWFALVGGHDAPCPVSGVCRGHQVVAPTDCDLVGNGNVLFVVIVVVVSRGSDNYALASDFTTRI
jgi:hypothetical protein